MFITHINGNPVFDTKSAERILQDLYTQYIQDQGVTVDNKSNSKSKSKSKLKSTAKSDFEFQITFAPERKLQDAKSKKAMDDFYGYFSGTTKTIKLKPDKLPNMKDVDDESERYALGVQLYTKFSMTLNTEAQFKDTILTRNCTLLYMMMEIKMIIIIMK